MAADKIINIDEGDINADWIKFANRTAQKQELAIHARLAKQFAKEAKGKPQTPDTTTDLSPDNPDVA